MRETRPDATGSQPHSQESEELRTKDRDVLHKLETIAALLTALRARKQPRRARPAAGARRSNTRQPDPFRRIVDLVAGPEIIAGIRPDIENYLGQVAPLDPAMPDREPSSTAQVSPMESLARWTTRYLGHPGRLSRSAGCGTRHELAEAPVKPSPGRRADDVADQAGLASVRTADDLRARVVSEDVGRPDPLCEWLAIRMVDGRTGLLGEVDIGQPSRVLQQLSVGVAPATRRAVVLIQQVEPLDSTTARAARGVRARPVPARSARSRHEVREGRPGWCVTGRCRRGVINPVVASTVPDADAPGPGTVRPGW